MKMLHYIYAIKNEKRNKMYIGMTNNAARRKKRHFSDLRCGVHDSLKLQQSFDKHGEENFTFHILEELECERDYAFEREEYFISKFDTFNRGYNMNKGGKNNNGFCTRFSREDLFKIYSSLEFGKRIGGALADIFETTKTTIKRIKSGESHSEFKIEYEKLTPEERLKIYNDFREEVNLDDFMYGRISTMHKKPMDEKQCLYVLSMLEFNNRRTYEMCKKLGVSGTAIYSLRDRSVIYKREFDKYTSMTFDERFDLYKEAYVYFNITCDFTQQCVK